MKPETFARYIGGIVDDILGCEAYGSSAAWEGWAQGKLTGILTRHLQNSVAVFDEGDGPFHAQVKGGSAAYHVSDGVTPGDFAWGKMRENKYTATDWTKKSADWSFENKRDAIVEDDKGEMEVEEKKTKYWIELKCESMGAVGDACFGGAKASDAAHTDVNKLRAQRDHDRKTVSYLGERTRYWFVMIACSPAQRGNVIKLRNNWTYSNEFAGAKGTIAVAIYQLNE